MNSKLTRLAIIGAGPAGLMVLQKLSTWKNKNLAVDIFESGCEPGRGMPYSEHGARKEHITNVSSDELPELEQQLEEYILGLPDETLDEFDIKREDFHEKKVVPRLLFGRYLNSQFNKLICEPQALSRISLHINSPVSDVKNLGNHQGFSVTLANGQKLEFDGVIICTGHQWKKKHELTTPNYFDSPYPPSKIAKVFNHKIVVRGSSLTAIDAIKTTAKCNGKFCWEGDNYKYRLNEDSPDFHIEMHSRDGLLPSVRVHMEEPHVDEKSLIEQDKIDENRRANNGFLELDFLYQQGFVEPLAKSDPEFYKQIKDLSIEEFVDKMMSYREDKDPFELLRSEYKQSLKSIAAEDAVPWKEMLASLSFAMNYPAKHLSAEDMLRLRHHLMPLISIVIAFVPQSSAETLLALHDAGVLKLISDGEGGEVDVSDDGTITYTYTPSGGKEIKAVCETFIDCIGQRPLNFEDFPFPSLREQGTISGATLKFRSTEKAKTLLAQNKEKVEFEQGEYFLKVPGLTITDDFQVVDSAGQVVERLYLMAVPHIAGYNPDYSGLDFCEQASRRIVKNMQTSSSPVNAEMKA